MTRRDLSETVLVQLLSDMPDLWTRTLRDHGDDGAGFCLSCQSSGIRARWPCRSWQIGAAAEAVATSRRDGPGRRTTARPARHELRTDGPWPGPDAGTGHRSRTPGIAELGSKNWFDGDRTGGW